MRISNPFLNAPRHDVLNLSCKSEQHAGECIRCGKRDNYADLPQRKAMAVSLCGNLFDRQCHDFRCHVELPYELKHERVHFLIWKLRMKPDADDRGIDLDELRDLVITITGKEPEGKKWHPIGCYCHDCAR